MTTNALSIDSLRNIATRLRIDSVRSTTEAGSGHPTTCLSAAEIVAALFFAEMRFDPRNPQNPDTDRFVLSKGHAAPILYAAWAEAGAFDRERAAQAARDRLGPRGASDAAAAVRRRRHRLARPGPLRGRRHRAERAAHRVRLPHVRAARRRRNRRRLGLGSRAGRAELDKLDNLCAIIDVNAFGQSRADAVGHDMDAYVATVARVRLARDRRRRPRPRGACSRAFAEARRTKGRPTMIVARTLKGKGVSFSRTRTAGTASRSRRARSSTRRSPSCERSSCPEAAAGDPEAGGQRPAAAATGDVAGAARACLQARRQRRDARGVRHGARRARRRRRAHRRARRRRQELDVQREVRAAASRPLLPDASSPSR